MVNKRSMLPPEAIGLAKSQRGLVTATQLLSLGMSRGAVRSLVDHGVLVRLEHNVFELIGAPGGYAHDAMRAVLAIGTPLAISDGSAARICGFEQLGEGVIEVTLPPGRRTARTCALLRHRPLPQGDVMSYRGLPVTSPPRLLADLVLQPYDTKFLGRLVDHLFRVRLLTPRSLMVGLGGLEWHPGHLPMRRLVDAHIEGLRIKGRLPDTTWEIELARWLVGANLPAPVRQHQVEIDGVLRFIDLAIPQYMVAIEFDGFEVHSGRGAFDDDRRRVDDLSAIGWRVVLITSAMGEAEVVRRVARAIEQQRQALGAA